MKQNFLTILLLSALAIFMVTNSVFAYEYKVYNPRQNKTYTALMGTVGMGNNQYIFGFFDKRTHQPLCTFTLHYTNRNKEGLWGGHCYELDDDEKELGYREFTPNTFDNEIQSIIEERRQQGYHYYYEQ